LRRRRPSVLHGRRSTSISTRSLQNGKTPKPARRFRAIPMSMTSRSGGDRIRSRSRRPSLANGSFVRIADVHLDVPLFWQCWKLDSPMVEAVTAGVRSAANDLRRMSPTCARVLYDRRVLGSATKNANLHKVVVPARTVGVIIIKKCPRAPPPPMIIIIIARGGCGLHRQRSRAGFICNGDRGV
jgi:hypothetical protein